MMHVAVRPWAAAGATLVVAGAVAVSPVTVPVAAPPTVVSAAVELAALPTWLQWINTGAQALGAQFGAIAAGVQNEVQHPVPIITAMVRNQVINVQNIGEAALNSAQSLSFAPIFSALTTLGANTLTRATGTFNAVVAGVGPITGALLNIPVAIFNAVVASGLAVLGSIISLNPLNVVGALGDAAVNLETAAFNAAAGVVTAVGNLRQAVNAAVAYPLPASAAVARTRATTSRAAVATGNPARPAASAKAAKAGVKPAAARPGRPARP